jgi:CRP-like cAMP-binding protein
VGYGDIIPVNNTERAFASFALLIGALVFGYMLSSIGSMIAALDRQAALSEEKMDAIKEYMRWRKFPRELTVRMRRYYEYFYERKTAFDEAEILEGLTPPLRFEVVRHTLKEGIGRIPLFRETLDPLFQLEAREDTALPADPHSPFRRMVPLQKPRLLTGPPLPRPSLAPLQVFPLFKPVSALPKEIIFNKGEPSHGIFFLLKGRAEAVSWMRGYENKVLYTVRQGQSFGESVLTGRRRAATLRAVTHCEMYTISAGDLQDLFTRRPREGTFMHQALLLEHVRKEKKRALSLRMLINKLSYKPSVETLEMISAVKLQLVWCRTCEQLALKSMPLQEPKGMSLSEDISSHLVAPPGATLPPPPSPAELRKGQTQKLLGKKASRPYSPTASSKSSFVPRPDLMVDRQNGRHSPISQSTSVQALHADVRRLIAMMGEMKGKIEQVERRVEDHRGSFAPGIPSQINGLRVAPIASRAPIAAADYSFERLNRAEPMQQPAAQPAQQF